MLVFGGLLILRGDFGGLLDYFHGVVRVRVVRIFQVVLFLVV